jgi:hypothetical protein
VIKLKITLKSYEKKAAGVAQSMQYLGHRLYEVRLPAEVMKRNFCFTTASKSSLGPNSASYSMDTEDLSPGVKRPKCEPDLSPPSNADVKDAWSYNSTPPYIFMVWSLIKHRDNFTLLDKRNCLIVMHLTSGERDDRIYGPT